jgi:catechol 2,3-dioxygenase-like lactoylglutathione lyase family enzyme
MLSVASLAETMAFYCDRLGFQVINRYGNPPAWCMLGRDGIRIMFNQPPAHEMAGLQRHAKDFQIYYFYPDDVPALHEAWRGRGIPVTDLRVTSYHMQEFELRDPDGYWLWFGQETTAPATTGD